MQNNGNFEKITRTNKPRKDARQAQPTGKQWKREDKRGRFSQQ